MEKIPGPETVVCGRGVGAGVGGTVGIGTGVGGGVGTGVGGDVAVGSSANAPVEIKNVNKVATALVSLLSAYVLEKSCLLFLKS